MPYRPTHMSSSLSPLSSLSLRRLISVVALIALFASACSDAGDDGTARPEPTSSSEETGSDPAEDVPAATGSQGGISMAQRNSTADTDITVTLSDANGDRVEPPVDRIRQAGSPLSGDDADRLLQRLPDVATGTDDQVEFRLPVDTRPPPRSGATIDQPFPAESEAPAGPRTPVDGPLEVLRFQPEGAVDTAPFISVTFNQPMIALSTVEQTSQADVPIEITPALDGRWIWLGTRTARFEHEPSAFDRIPMATEFRVAIPAGTTSATGNTLAEAVQFAFTTPAATATSAWPVDTSLRTDSLFFIEFNQQINAQAALDAITVTADGTEQAMRLATPQEIDDDESIAQRAAAALEARYLVMVAEQELPYDSAIEIVVGPRTPSAEGSLTTEDTQRFSARTYGALRQVGERCGWDSGCRPGDMFHLEFSNPLDTTEFDASFVTITPDLPGAQISAQWNEITIRANTAGRTTYTIAVDGALTDEFGQSLGTTATATFDVGDARPALFSPPQLVTLDPVVDDGALYVTSINNERLNVEVWQVDPDDDWQKYNERYWEILDGNAQVSWNQASDEEIRVAGEPNTFTETAIDLRDELAASGHVVVKVSPQIQSDDEWQNRAFLVWVQRTNLALDISSDSDQVIARVTNLSTGTGVEGATVQLSSGAEAVTGSNGVVQFDLVGRSQGATATADGETALLGNLWLEPWNRSDEVRWHVLDDRGVYRPGETANIKGWLRSADWKTPARLTLPTEASSVSWTARDAFGNEFASGQTELSNLGGFDIALEIPESTTPGPGSIEFTTSAFGGAVDSPWFWKELQVQDFRRPDFEVNVEQLATDPVFVGDASIVEVAASYFAGGALSDSDVEWNVSAQPSSYSPPMWPDFEFGIWQPWWWGGGFDDGRSDFGSGFSPSGTLESWSAQTDDAGEHKLAITTAIQGTPRPVSMTASATVFDVNRQPISGQTPLLVHPSELYVGVHGNDVFVQSGEPIEVDVIVTDLDGNTVDGVDIDVSAVLLDWTFSDGIWSETEELADTCRLTSQSEPLTCALSAAEGGQYRIRATVTDDAGRPNVTELQRWVAGGDRPSSRRVALEELTVVPNGQVFSPGETAEVLVQAPFASAEGLLIISRGAISSTRPIEFDSSGTAIVSIPISADDVPQLGLYFEATGSTPRSDGSGADRPAYASGQLTLEVSTDQSSLTVQARPRQERLTPGDGTVVDVVVTDSNGDPVPAAELAVIVVDEAVLSLTGYELIDPLASFYARSGGWVQTERGRSSLLLADPTFGSGGNDRDNGGADGDAAATTTTAQSPADSSADSAAMDEESAMDDSAENIAGSSQRQFDGADKSASQSPIDLRTNFDAVAVFEPEVTTDIDGRATIDVALPDNLTRYRIMVVAAAEASMAGTGESNITAQLPITVRPTPPLFANFGDRFEFPIVIQNTTDQVRTVEVALRSTNLALDGSAGATVDVPANDRLEVRIPVRTEQAGIARWQVAVSSGDLTDAAQGEFPVYTPATREAFATYGVLDSGSISQPLTAPVNVFSQFGGLEVTTSSTAVSALTDAVRYINDYRYTSSDALASRIIAITALDSVLDAFDAPELPGPQVLRDRVQSDVDELVSLQNDDGGFPWWRRNRPSIPWASAQAAHALVLAEQSGATVPNAARTNALTWLESIEQVMPSWYDQPTRNALSAYAMHVRHLAGDSDTAKAARLHPELIANEQLDALAWLWPVVAADSTLDEETERFLNNRVTETPNGATFTTSYGEQGWLLLHSDRRTDAIVLQALLSQRPNSDLIPKTLNAILATRDRAGRWANIQENSFILLAGSSYFEAFEDVEPAFVARVWLGDTYAAEQTFEGRQTDRQASLVPMSVVTDTGDTEVIIDKDGDGRLYYRLGLRYAPTDLVLDPSDQGFVVTRTYEAIDDESDVSKADDGTWTVKAGSRVRVRLTMVADSQRTHVALTDPIPAGFEMVNPSLATSESIPSDPSAAQPRNWWYRWFEHQALRDDRAEAFSTRLGAGTYEFTYVVRATTPGTFVTPPTRAEQIYEPEVFGRSGSTVVEIIETD